MMPKKLPSFSLPAVEELFSTQEERDDAKREKVIEIPLSNIDSFPEHPFQVKVDEAMQMMVDSVKAVGIQTPAVVRLKDDGRYEMVSGHRRKLACELAGLEVMPCIVRKMNQDEAVIAMVDANLQREVILPSEKAKSYKMKLDAMKRQGQRTDITSRQLGEKWSVNLMSEEGSDSARQIHRYIRLTELTSQLLDMVDNNTLAMRSAVELSYLTKEQQQILLDVMRSEGCILSYGQAMKLRKVSEENSLDYKEILAVMQEDKSNQQGHFKLPKEKIRRFFPAGTSAEVIEDTIIKALDLWRSSSKTK